MLAYIILVFVETQDMATPVPDAMARAAREALGPAATILVRPVDPGSPSQALVTSGRQQGAAVVARVSWAGGSRVDARVEVTTVATGLVKAAVLTFEESDPLAEKGRALGLVLAALVRPEVAGNADQPRAPPPPPEVVTTAAPPAQPAAPARWALDVAAEGSMAFAGAGSGAGGTAGLRWLRFGRMGLRAGVRARFGQVGQAQATLMTFAVTAGVTVSLREPRDDRRFGFGLRADAGVGYESLSHLSEDDPAADRQGRLLPVASLLAEARWSLSPSVALLLAAGPEVAFGTTRVFVGGSQVAELVPVRAAIQGGLLASF
jgi:hypothetical protein